MSVAFWQMMFELFIVMLGISAFLLGLMVATEKTMDWLEKKE